MAIATKTTNAVTTETKRLLSRYFCEVIEPFGLCPWARPAREKGELSLSVVCDDPPQTALLGEYDEHGIPLHLQDQVVAAARQAVAQPGTKVAIIAVLHPSCDRIALRELRTRATQVLPGYGVADFHPDNDFAMTSPARLILGLRRGPDPFLQLVPFAILDAIRARSAPVDRTDQLAMLINPSAVAHSGDIGDEIARRNLATVSSDGGAALVAAIAAVHSDRNQTYARLGILRSSQSR